MLVTQEIARRALDERLELLGKMTALFESLFGHPARVRRGEAQNAILDHLGLRRTGHHRALVSEALCLLGYRKVKTEGVLFYRSAP